MIDWIKSHDSFSHALLATVMFWLVFLVTGSAPASAAFSVGFYYGREFTHNELARDADGTALPFWKRFLPTAWYPDNQRDLLYPVLAAALWLFVVGVVL
jgi:hypothetical protein